MVTNSSNFSENVGYIENKIRMDIFVYYLFRRSRITLISVVIKRLKMMQKQPVGIHRYLDVVHSK